MSLDINELVRLVKQAAVEAVRAEAPMAFCYGSVTGTAPLKIQVDQKKILGEAQLILTNAVQDHDLEVSTPAGRERWRVHNALKVGEKVLLLQCNGGQKYIVLDRLGAQ